MSQTAHLVISQRFTVCGIIGRMENSNLDETQATQAPMESTGETLPVLIDEDNPQDAEFAQTVPTPTGVVPLEEGSNPDTIQLTHEGAEEPDNLAATTRTPVAPPPEEPPAGEQTKSPGRRFPITRVLILVGILALLAIGVVSAYAGYRSGIQMRVQAGASLVSQAVDEQFDLGLQDMQAGRYDLARQRFEYVIRIDPNYPGAAEKLADSLVLANATATPTVFFTPTPSPTPDLRGVEERYTQSREHLQNFEWTPAIETLLSLRKADPTYQAVKVDGMLYVAFRNRGTDKILKNCDLEGGIFDLAQAEQFGPLDADADSYQTWASLYLTGASFWELDWAQVIYYFAQVAPALPNLCDGSGMTATERYRQGLVGYGDFLAQNGDICGALAQYQLAASFGTDTALDEKLANAVLVCVGPEEQPPAVTQDTPSPTPPAGVTPTTPPPPTQEPPPPSETPYP